MLRPRKPPLCAFTDVSCHVPTKRTLHATSLQIIIHNSKLAQWIEFIIATTGTTAIVGIAAIG